MRRVTKVALVACLAIAAPALANWTVPMNQQINLGFLYNTQTTMSSQGNAIYPAFDGATANTAQIIYADGALEPQGFTRRRLTSAFGAANWWYEYVDLNLAGITTPSSGLNLSSSSSKIEFDARFYQDEDTNSNPYYDAPIFVRIYTYGADGNSYQGYRDYGIVYGPDASSFPNGQWYPNWAHVVIDVNNAPGIADGDAFDITNVSRIRFYGTDWSGTGADFVDFKNLTFTPEPASIALLALGGLGLCRRRR
jgi:hypothetical protein